MRAEVKIVATLY